MIRLVPPQVLQVASQVARAFTLDSVSLESFSASRRRSLDVQGAAPLGTDIKEAAEGAIEEGGDILRAHVSFTFVAAPSAPKSKADKKPVIEIALTFEVVYRREIELPLQAEQVQHFVEVNAIYNTWPYLREALSSFTQRLGMPPFTLDSLVILPTPTSPPAKPPTKAQPAERSSTVAKK